MKSTVTLLAVLILACSQSISQIAFSESFDGATFVPAGWTNLLVSGTNTWTRVTAGTFPTQAPKSGAGEAKFNSYSVNGGVRALISPVINYSNRGSSATTVSFWMYRDNGYNATADKIDVYMNTAANLAGANLLGTVNRAIGLSPVVTTNGWYQYTFSVPASYTTATNYFIIRATSAFGNNIYIDDVSWTAFPPSFIDISPISMVSPLSNFNCFGNNQTISVQIKNNGSVPINFSTNPVTINCSVTVVPSNVTIGTNTVIVSPFILNTGVLAVGASTNVTISNSFNMSVSGTYSFNVNTSIVGDANNLNDNMPVSTNIVSKVNTYPFEVDFSSLPNPSFLVQQVSGTGNWSNVVTGNLTFPTLAPVLNSGNGFAYFNSFSYSSGTVSNLILPNFDFTTISSPVLDLWVSQDNGYSSSNDRLDILVSLDGGNTWSTSLLTISRYNAAYTSPGWKLFSVPLSAYVGNPCARFAIRATSAFGNNMAIDYLKVYDAAVILPIKLIAFTGDIYNEKQNILFWQTAEEVNTKMFRIDRSYDGINFTTRHFENAKGENFGSNYSYVDNIEKEVSIIYYRLVSIDLDNTTEIFKVISIERNYSRNFSSVLYPNPTEGRTTLEVVLEADDEVLVEISNSKGEIVNSNTHQLHSGQNKIDVLSESFIRGIYFIKLKCLSNASDKSNFKLVVL